jgi:hypothetical protein
VEESAYSGGASVGIGYVAVGARLGRFSASTREVLERLLSATFVLWGFAYVCWQIPRIFDHESLLVPPYTAGRLSTDAGTVRSAFFLRRVFRPDSRVANGLVLGN